jgi:hypothetical protein
VLAQLRDRILERFALAYPAPGQASSGGRPWSRYLSCRGWRAWRNLKLIQGVVGHGTTVQLRMPMVQAEW